MLESTARDFQNYENVAQQPRVNESVNTNVGTISHKVAVSKTESLLLIGLGILTLVLMTALVTTKVSLTAATNSLDAVTTKITNTNTDNVNLQQEVSEMTSYDRLSSFAKKHNLKMNNQNVRNVTK